MAGEALSPRNGRCERARQWASLRLDGELLVLSDGMTGGLSGYRRAD